MEHPEVSIVMPCLNEAETVGVCIRKAKKKLKDLDVKGEVIVADNGSNDGSAEFARQTGARVINVKEKGYGAAVKGGIREATGIYIIMGDADDSYNFSEIAPFINKLKEGNDLIMGNRLKGGIKKHAMPFLHRYIGNPVLSFIGRIFFKVPVSDFHCGMRAFTRDAFGKMELKSDGMEFASEMVVKAALKKLKIAEIPVTLYPDGRSKKPHLNTWRDGWRHLRFLLMYAPHWLFLFPGLFMIMGSVILLPLLLFHPLHLGNINLGVHTILYLAVFLQTGIQFLFFYIIVKSYAFYHNFLPLKKFETRIIEMFSLEKGLVVGVPVFLAGIILSVLNLLYWKQEDFGDLDPVLFMRQVIPAVTFLFTGIQIIVSSFIVGIIKHKNI